MSFPETLQSVWAPWRVEYFSIDKSRDFLAEAAHTDDDRGHLVLRRLKSTFLLMNRYPYTVGHLMAVPYRKVADIAELTAEERAELWDQAAFGQKILRRVVHAEGFNVGLNLGKAGGAGVADHLHLHIVPRWEGDNNFMPVLSGVRVMAESLDTLYAKLAEAAAAES